MGELQCCTAFTTQLLAGTEWHCGLPHPLGTPLSMRLLLFLWLGPPSPRRPQTKGLLLFPAFNINDAVTKVGAACCGRCATAQRSRAWSHNPAAHHQPKAVTAHTCITNRAPWPGSAKPAEPCCALLRMLQSKFDNMYGCQHSVLDGIRRATDIMISGGCQFGWNAN